LTGFRVEICNARQTVKNHKRWKLNVKVAAAGSFMVTVLTCNISKQVQPDCGGEEEKKIT